MPTPNYSAELREATVAAHADVLTSELQAQASADVAFATVTRAFEDRQLAIEGLTDARTLFQLSTVIDEQAEWYKLTAQNVLALGQASAAKAATAAAAASAAATAAKQAADALGNLTDKLGAICNRTDGIGGIIDDQAQSANVVSKQGAEASQQAKFAAMRVSVAAAESKAPAVLTTLQTLLDEFTGLAAGAKTTWTSAQTRAAGARKQLSDTLAAEAKAALAYAQSESDLVARDRALAIVDGAARGVAASSTNTQIQATVTNVPASTTGVTFFAVGWSTAQQFGYGDFLALPASPAPASRTAQRPSSPSALVQGTKADKGNTYSATITQDASGDPLKLGSTYCVFAVRSVAPNDPEFGHDTLLSSPSEPVVVQVGLSWGTGSGDSAPAPKVTMDDKNPLMFTVGAQPTVQPAATEYRIVEYRILIVRDDVLSDYLQENAAEEMSLVGLLNPAYYYVWPDDGQPIGYGPKTAEPAYVDMFGEPIDLAGASYRALVLVAGEKAIGDQTELLLSGASNLFGTAAAAGTTTPDRGTNEEGI